MKQTKKKIIMLIKLLFLLTGLSFEIAEGGFLDIDVTITGPDGAEIYRGERESSGMYTFSAPVSGRYTYCFSNKMSTMTPKVRLFSLIYNHFNQTYYWFPKKRHHCLLTLF